MLKTDFKVIKSIIFWYHPMKGVTFADLNF